MIKIYASYVLQVIFDLAIMAAILYGVFGLFFGVEVSEIVTGIVRGGF